MNNFLNWYKIDLDNMILICIKHGQPFQKEDECAICIQEEMEELKDDLLEGQRRKEWESRHKKTLGK